MTIKIKFFAQLRDITKMAELELEIKENSTIADLSELLAERFPEIRQHLQAVSFAVDNEYFARNLILKDGNEVALIPPISGG